jgi:roadblock/LC7 domain-containing protein
MYNFISSYQVEEMAAEIVACNSLVELLAIVKNYGYTSFDDMYRTPMCGTDISTTHSVVCKIAQIRSGW